ESVRHRERDVLAVVANDIIIERWPPFDADAVDALPESRTENLSDVLMMQNRADAGHLLCGGGVELRDLSIGNRRIDRNRVQQSWKVKVGGIVRCSGHLQRPIDARSVATYRRCCSSLRHVRRAAWQA